MKLCYYTGATIAQSLEVHAMNNVDHKDIITNVASDIIKDSIKCAWEKTKSFLQDLSAKESMEYGLA
jgi:hypothetical protein